MKRALSVIERLFESKLFNTYLAHRQLGVAVLYALMLYIGELSFESEVIVGYFEPASGLALAALLIGGKRYSWGLFIGGLLANAINENPIVVAVTIASCDILQALCGAWLLTLNGKFDVRLNYLHDYLRLILLGGCASIFIGTVVVNTVLLFLGVLSADSYVYSLQRWWMSDTLGVILVAPLIMLWWNPEENRREILKVAEAALMLVLTIVVCQIIFLGWWHDAIGPIAKGYWMFLIVVWVALRIGSCGTIILLVMTAIYALLGATRGVGYFAEDIAQTHLVNYWFYMVTLSVTGMALATYFTERELADAVLRKNEANMKAILDNSPYMSWLKDVAGRYVRVNKAYLDYTRLGDIRRIIGKTDFDLWPRALAEKYRADDNEIIAARRQKHVEEKSFNGDNEHWVETFKTPIIDVNGDVLGTTGFARDITERKRSEEQIHYLAFYDALTQLPNRRMLNDRLEQAMAASKRNGCYAALIFLDLDNFKPVNDIHGHGVGDLLLVEAARRISQCVRKVDTVARFGGDEFVVVLGELGEDKNESSVQAATVAEKIRAALAAPYWLAIGCEGEAGGAVEHRSGASIGVVLFSNHEISAEDIVKCADIAMYQAKGGGRNSIRFFEP